MNIYIYIYIERERERERERPLTFRKPSFEPLEIRSKQRDPNPKDNSLTGKETSTCKGCHSTFAASFSY